MMLTWALIVILGLIPQLNCLYVTDELTSFGFTNQLLFLQATLKYMLERYPDATMLLNGPKRAQHLSSTFGNKMFSDFFTLRTVDECLKLVSEADRKHLCARHINFLQRATEKFTSQMHNQAIKVTFDDISNHYCMPWNLKSSIVAPLHCPVGKVHDLPFFFELFDFHENIKQLANQFLIENQLQEYTYTSLHFRLGDFKTRGDFQQYLRYFTAPFPKAISYTESKMKHHNIVGKVFVMAEFEHEINRNSFRLSSAWISQKLAQSGYLYPAESVEFLKLLIEMIVASKAQFIVGNHFSTLSEIIMSYGILNNPEIKYDFYQ